MLATTSFVGACLVLTLTVRVGAIQPEMMEVHNDDLPRDKRLMVTDASTWPKAIIPYTLEPEVKNRLPEYKRVMSFIEDHSCIRFTPWDEGTAARLGLGHPGHIKFYKANACHSLSAGFNKDPQGARVSCCTDKTCLHELGHVIGFYHEQGNPRRDGWIRINQQNVIPESRNSWVKYKTNINASLPYDMTSIMQYQDWADSRGGPVFTKLFPDLTVGDQYYYFFMEMAGGYRCHEKPQCKGELLNCENDGYQTIVHGKCACKCPPGLDPGNMCRTVLKKVTRGSWPQGQYSLPMPSDGCPHGGNFSHGWIKYPGPGENSMSNPTHMKGTVQGKQTELHFCTKTTKDEVYDTPEGSKFNWPNGNYCIYQKGNTCPDGFVSGSIHHSSTENPTTSGQLPDGAYDKRIELKMCCSWRGFHEDPMLFPTDKPFYLIKHPDDQCEAVEGMRFREETFTLTSPGQETIDPLFYKWRKKSHQALVVHMCYYTPVDMNCGGVLVLSKVNPETIIEMSGHGRTDVRCTWLVMGDTDKGNVVLDFEEFNLRKNGDSCDDRVEVRHFRLGQRGTDYKPYECFPEQKQPQSERSVYDKMMIRFFTTGNSQSSFKAKVRWTANEDMCYSVEHRGAHYDGSVNYSLSFLPCLPWAEMTHCPHNPFARGDGQANLDGNACRNPDHSFRPWCYTDKTGCAREYCDVCGLEKPFDRIDFCAKLKKEGFCTRDATQAVKYCAKTCMNLLPKNLPMKTSMYQSCGRPVPPSDGTVVGTLGSSYKVGDTVQYKCKTMSGVVTSTCLTSGRWSQVGSSCLPACAAGQVFYNTECYAAAEEGKRFFGFSRAMMSCTKAGGTLAAPKSLEESNVITGIIQRLESTKKRYQIWIHITDMRTEGTFRYRDGKPLVWTNWDPYEPDTDTKDGDKNDCVVMKKTGKWMNTRCSYWSQAVCVFPPNETSACSDILEDKCTSLLSDRPSMCEDFPDFVRYYCRDTCEICKRSDIRCPIKNTKPNVLTLAEGKSTISVGEYVNYECDRFKYRVKGHASRACLPDGTLSGDPLECGECPVGFKLMNQACHGLLVSTEMTTFSDSKLACKKLDGFLAMPKTQAENTYIASLGHGKPVRLGLTDHYTTRFVWQDGVGVAWSGWADGYPDKYKNRHCAVMTNDTQWKTANCDAKNADMVTVCTIPKTDDDLCYDIEDGGVSYDGKANYTQAHEPCVPWTQATTCPHHAFNKGDETDNLEENYCRNPDNSYRPWCYTDIVGCKRNFCDVCGHSLQHDRVENCQTLKSQGVCVMEPDRALKDCAATCRDDLNIKTPVVKKFRDIRCGPPLPPTDGVVVGQVKNEYKLGETVQFKCKTDPWSVYSRCMTSGQWSDAGFACLQTDCVGTILDNTCYHLLDNGHHYNYEDGVAKCAARKAVIATPKSQKESEFIRKLMHSSSFVMLGIKFVEGKWVNQDGTKLTWTNWNQHERKTNSRDCAALFGTEWLYISCGRSYPVVCVTPRKTSCSDYLVSKCPRLLVQSPNMCQQHKGFATVYCSKTCRLCNE